MKMNFLKKILIFLNVVILGGAFGLSQASASTNEVEENSSALTNVTSEFDFEALRNNLMNNSSIKELQEKLEEKNNTEYRVLIELDGQSLVSKYLSDIINKSENIPIVCKVSS